MVLQTQLHKDSMDLTNDCGSNDNGTLTFDSSGYNFPTASKVNVYVSIEGANFVQFDSGPEIDVTSLTDIRNGLLGVIWERKLYSIKI